MPIASQRPTLIGSLRVAAPPQHEGEEQQHRERQIGGDHHVRAHHQRAGEEQRDAEQRRRHAGGDLSQQPIDQQAAEQQKQYARQPRRDLVDIAERRADRGDDPRLQRRAFDKANVVHVRDEPVAGLQRGPRDRDGKTLMGIVAAKKNQRHRQHRPGDDDDRDRVPARGRGIP